jgi:hypothetical protein
MDEPAPTDVAKQIIRVVLGLQIPLLPFAVLQAEFTHDRVLPWAGDLHTR